MITLGSTALVHALTLPMELNTSFAQALPFLDRGRYLIDGAAGITRNSKDW